MQNLGVGAWEQGSYMHVHGKEGNKRERLPLGRLRIYEKSSLSPPPSLYDLTPIIDKVCTLGF